MIKLILAILLSSLCIAKELISPKLIEKAQEKYGKSAKNRFEDIQNNLLAEQKNKSDLEKLDFVNTKFNKIKYATDMKTYHTEDYWATLYEFVGKNRGDCEDYVIAKYYALKALGVDPKRLKFVYVIYQKKNGKRENHMVLAYLKRLNPKGKEDFLILDNNNHLVLPASMRPNLVKIIGMINGDTGSRSKKWEELDMNMKKEKL